MSDNHKMTMEEAADYISKHLLQSGDDNAEIEKAEEARLLAFQALNELSDSIVCITTRPDKAMSIDVSRQIGTILNNDDVADDNAGQRYYAIHALTFALAALARDQIEDGYDVDAVMSMVLDALCNSFNDAAGIILDVGKLSPDEAATFIDKQTRNRSRLS